MHSRPRLKQRSRDGTESTRRTTPAQRLAAELADTIAAFEALRGTLVFEDEPSSFEAALQATKETA